jgi:hypothetical protein
VHVTGKDADLVKAILTALATSHVGVSSDEPFPHGGVSFGVMLPTTAPDAVVFVGIKPIAE